MSSDSPEREKGPWGPGGKTGGFIYYPEVFLWRFFAPYLELGPTLFQIVGSTLLSLVKIRIF